MKAPSIVIDEHTDRVFRQVMSCFVDQRHDSPGSLKESVRWNVRQILSDLWTCGVKGGRLTMATEMKQEIDKRIALMDS